MKRDKFVTYEVERIDSLCDRCKHRSRIDPRICLAFPGGIPYEFLIGKEKHDHPVKGDGGIQFEPR